MKTQFLAWYVIGFVGAVVISSVWIALLWHLRILFQETLTLKAKLQGHPRHGSGLAALRRGSGLATVLAVLGTLGLGLWILVQLLTLGALLR